MQRKRPYINFDIFSKSPGKGKDKFNNSITNTTLHSIPTVRMSESNQKSFAYCLSTFFLLGLGMIINMLNTNSCYAAANPTASLSVSNPTLSATAAPGDTAYLSSNVTYSASDIDSYTLQVSYANGYSSLKLDGGTTTLAGAGGKTGSNLTNNSWGFAWTNNTTNNTSTNAGLTYYTVPSYGTSGSGLSAGRLEAASNLTSAGNTTLSSTTKRIVFAAKFAENNTNSGHYKTGVQLSMVAVPRKIVYAEWRTSDATSSGYDASTTILQNSGITTMQEMTKSVCNQVTTPAASATTVPTIKLKDSRDNNEYIVAKYADGRCWMTSNLLLKGQRTLTSNDSNVESDYALSAPLTSLSSTDFSSSMNNVAQSYSSSLANSGNTMYYSWFAAGAGSWAIEEDSQTSICPKGWILPTVNVWKEFITNASIANSSVGSQKVQAYPYNFRYTGYVENGVVSNLEHGSWFSSYVDTSCDVYTFQVTSSSVSTTGSTKFDYSYRGRPIRCIARDS